MQNIYTDGTYEEHNKTWHEEDSSWKASQIFRLMEKNNLHPSTICEVGCGAGGILQHLSEGLGDRVVFTGYEISPQAFELCRSKAKSNLSFVLDDLLTVDEVSFDIVMAIDVFEHVEDYLGFIRALRSKATYKIFHIPLDLSVQSVLRCSPIMRARNSVGHLHYFSKETALATLEHSGYEVVDYFYTRGSLERPKRGWKAGLLRTPRSLLYRANQDLAVRLLGGFSLMVLAK